MRTSAAQEATTSDVGAKFANHDTTVAAAFSLRFLPPHRLVSVVRRSALPHVLCSTFAGAALFLSACAPPATPIDVVVAVREVELDPDAAEPEAAPTKRPQAACGPLVWLRSEQEGLARGKAEGRPVLVHFATEWCADCKRMVSETFGDPRVKDQAGRFVAVRIEATNDEDPEVSAALLKYSVVNVPTLILLDSSGNERRRITEVIGPDKLLTELALIQ